MPRLLVIDEETKDFATLTKSLFPDRLGRAERASALAALTRHNPDVDLRALHPGQVLVLPEVPGIKPSAGEPLGKPGFDGFAGAVREGVRLVIDQARNERKASETERDELALALKLALKGRPELKARVELATKLLKEEQQAEAEAELKLTKTLKQALADIEALAERHFR